MDKIELSVDLWTEYKKSIPKAERGAILLDADGNILNIYPTFAGFMNWLEERKGRDDPQ